MKRFIQGFSSCLSLVIFGYISMTEHVYFLCPAESKAIRESRKCDSSLIVVIGHRENLPNISERHGSGGIYADVVTVIFRDKAEKDEWQKKIHCAIWSNK